MIASVPWKKAYQRDLNLGKVIGLCVTLWWMSVLDQQIRRTTEELVKILTDLVERGAGVPRPIISLTNDMPFELPMRQRAVQALRRFAKDHRDDFQEPTVSFIVHPYEDPAEKRSTQVAYPYAEFTQGQVVERLPDGSEVRLVRLRVAAVPAGWKSQRPLDLVIQARGQHRRYGEAIANAPVVNLRVPRRAIAGKDSGI